MIFLTTSLATFSFLDLWLKSIQVFTLPDHSRIGTGSWKCEPPPLLIAAGVASDDTPHLFIKLQLKSLNRNGRKLDDGGGHGVGSERGSGERGRPFVHPTAASGISCCSTPQQIVIIIGAGLTHNP